MKKERIQLHLSPEVATALRVEAAKRGTQGAMSKIAEEILREGLGMTVKKTDMTYEQIVNEARRRATESGLITDNREECEADPNLWYVKDIQLVIDAYIKDIEAGDTAEDAGPEEFFARHGIEVE